MKYLFLSTVILIFLNCYCFAEILGDVNDDNQVNVTEAIHALQVSAGINNNITITDNSLDAADGNPKNALYIDNYGRIGIGTTEPYANLTLNPGSEKQFNKQLSGLVTVAPNSRKVIGNSSTLFTQELKVGDTVLIANEFISISLIADDRTFDLSIEHVSGAFNEPIFTSSDIVAIYDLNNKPALVIDNAGDFGIGTSSPGSKLDVNGHFIRKIFRNSGVFLIGDSNGSFVYKKVEPIQVPNKTLILNKLKDETAIKVEYSDLLGAYDACGRCVWEIRIDGKSCPNQPLYFSNYYCTPSDQSRSLFFHNLKGYCEGINAGTHEIQVWVHMHEDYVGKSSSVCRTGTYETTWTIEAQEVY